MASLKLGVKIGNGDAAKIRIKIDISEISGRTPKEPGQNQKQVHTGTAPGTTLPLPFPQLPEDTDEIGTVNVLKPKPGFWQRLFSRFRSK